MSVPFNGNQAWINNLKLEIEKPWRQWRAFDDQDNVSRYVIDYKGLTFCTIKGIGHMLHNRNQKKLIICFLNSLTMKVFK